MLDGHAEPTPVAALDADADLAWKAALDRPPTTDKLAAIRDISARRQDRGWLKTFVAAARGPGRLTVDEFFYYRLDRPGMTPEAARAYVGKKMQHRMHSACNNAHWFAPSHDKLLFYTILAGAGLPRPETLAHFAAARRSGSPTREMTPENVLDWLRQAEFPVFAKPVAGLYSIGTLLIDGMEGTDVHLRSHGTIPCDALVGYMRRVSREGYLVQRVLSGSPALAAQTGGTVASLRLLVIASETPKVLSAALKLPAGSNVADNFWRKGNMLAAIDRETGTVTRAIVNGSARLPEEVPEIAGLVVPEWQAARDMVLEAATIFPPIRTQSWDVALTDRGPVLLEFNFGGDLNLHQLSHDHGILTDEFREHLGRCGYKGKLR